MNISNTYGSKLVIKTLTIITKNHKFGITITDLMVEILKTEIGNIDVSPLIKKKLRYRIRRAVNTLRAVNLIIIKEGKSNIKTKYLLIYPIL